MSEIKSASWPLQEAIYDRFKNDSTITVNVYDEVDETATLPYITIGEDTVTDFSTKDYTGENTTVTLHCFSNYEGKKEAKQLLDLMLRSLTKTPLTVVGFSVEDLQREFLTVINEQGIYHGIMRIRLKIKPI
jgi:N-acetyl-beta-hexosaminidase